MFIDLIKRRGYFYWFFVTFDENDDSEYDLNCQTAKEYDQTNNVSAVVAPWH